MRTLNGTQQTLVDAAYKEKSWLFTVVTVGVSTYRWSLKAKSYGGQSYTAKIQEFKGITLSANKSEFGIQAPNDLSFVVGNADDALTASDFEGASVTITPVLESGGTESSLPGWKFVVRKCWGYYGKLFFICEDFIQQYLKGEYPNTKLVKELAPSTHSIEDNLCVPVVFANSTYKAYIPIRPVYVTGDAKAYYVLGPSGPTYNVYECKSPRAWPTQSTWISTTGGGSYTFTQSTKTLDGDSMRVIEPIIADANKDGTVDSAGFFENGDFLHDVPFKYYTSTSDYTSPANVISQVLQGYGVDSGDIDTAGSFASAATTYASWGLVWYGGFFFKEDRKVLLAKLLAMCHSVLRITDKVELHPLSKTSQKTFTKALRLKATDGSHDASGSSDGTFSYEPLDDPLYDSGYIALQEAGQPQDQLLKALVSARSTGETDYISSEVVEFPLVADTQDAQALGTLYFQRKYRRSGRISFSEGSSAIVLEPDDVATINNSLYGGSTAFFIEDIRINEDFTVDITGIVPKESLVDFGDLAPSAITFGTDTSSSFWKYVVCGPDTTVSSGSKTNMLPDRLRIGSGANYILLDNTDPSIKLYEGAQKRVEIGDIGASTYGIAFYTPGGATSLIIDASHNTITEMEYEIYTSGIIRTNANVAASGGWSVDKDHMIAYTNAPLKVFEVVFSGSDWGDFYVGDYANGNSGLFYDRSVPELYFAGNLTVDSFARFPEDKLMVFFLGMNEGYGIYVLDSSCSKYNCTFYTSYYPAWAAAFGIVGVTSLWFDGGTASDLISTDDTTTANLELNNSYWTFSFWINPYAKSAGTTTQGWFFRRGTGWNTNGNMILYDYTNERLVFYSHSASVNNAHSMDANTFDTLELWYHVAITCDKSDVIFYVNGEQVGDPVPFVAGTTCSSATFIGGNSGVADTGFRGYLDQFRVYRSASNSAACLGANQVKALYLYPGGNVGGRITAHSVVVGDSTDYWRTNKYGMFGVGSSESLFAFSIADSVSWDGGTMDKGDIVIGRYLSDGEGLFYDRSVPKMYYRGDLALESVPGFLHNRYCFLDVDFAEQIGSLLHDGSKIRGNGTITGPDWVASPGGIIGGTLQFISTNSDYVTFGTGDHGYWDVLGSGNRGMGWLLNIYISSAPSTAQVLMAKGGYNVSGWYIVVQGTDTTPGVIRLQVNKSGSSTSCPATTAITYGAWNQVIFIYNFDASDNGTVDIYLNGEYNTTITSVVTMADASSYALVLGKHSAATAYCDAYFCGPLKIFNGLSTGQFTKDHAKAYWKYPQGSRGGQLTARSVVVGNPVKDSTPGIRIDDTGIWTYGASGNELFGFCTIASGTVTWEGLSLSAGHFTLGDYSASKGLYFDGSSFNFKGNIVAGTISSGQTLTVSGGSVVVNTSGSFEVTSGTAAFGGTTFEVSATSATINTTAGLILNTANGLIMKNGATTLATLYYSGTYVYLQPSSATQLWLGSGSNKYSSVYIYTSGLTVTADSAVDFTAGTGAMAIRQTYVDISLSGTLIYNFYGAQFYAIGAGAVNFGQSSSNYWAYCYGVRWYGKGGETGGTYHVYQAGYDHYDDIGIVDSMSTGREPISPFHFPKEVTNLPVLQHEYDLSDDELESVIYDGNVVKKNGHLIDKQFIADRTFWDGINLALFDLCVSKAIYQEVKELRSRVSELERRLQ